MSAEIMSRVMETQWGDPLFKFFMLTLADGINPDGEFTVNIEKIAVAIEVAPLQAADLWNKAIDMHLVFPTNQRIGDMRVWVIDFDNPAWNRLTRWNKPEVVQ